MIYVPCRSRQNECSAASELLAKPNYSSNLSPHVRRRWGGEGHEMKMTRPDLIVVSICSPRQDVCLNVHLSICPSVSLLSRRRALCEWVRTLWLHTAIIGTGLILRDYRDTIINTTQSDGKRFLYFSNCFPYLSPQIHTVVRVEFNQFLPVLPSTCWKFQIWCFNTFVSPITSPAWHTWQG